MFAAFFDWIETRLDVLLHADPSQLDGDLESLVMREMVDVAGLPMTA